MRTWLAGRLAIAAVVSPLGRGGTPRTGLQSDIFLTRWQVLGPIPIAGSAGAAPDEHSQKSAFDSPMAVRSIVGLVSDDAIKVWLNGMLVHQNWIQRAVQRDQDLAAFELRKGKNVVVLKIQNASGDWGFAMRTLGPRNLEERLWQAARGGDVERLEMLVSRDGAVLFEGGYRYADIENQVRVTPATKFRIGSITKQFTAAAILRLQEQGRLSVSDPLAKYVPDFPNGETIKSRNLYNDIERI